MQVRLKEVPNMLLVSYMAKANMWMWSKPRVGKTTTVEAFAAKMVERVPEFKIARFYAPAMSPMDIQAAMMEAGSDVMKIVNNAGLPNGYTEPNWQGVVVFDEMGNGDPSTNKLLQKYINRESMSGKLILPDGAIVIAMSNRMQDKAGGQQQLRALMARFHTHLDVYTEAEDNMDYAERHQWHPTVQSFFHDWPALIDNYEDVFESVGKKKSDELAVTAEEGKRGVWAHMGGWEAISHKEFAVESLKCELHPAMVTGSVGSGVGAQYVAHRSMVGRLASIEQIVADPKGVKVPEKISELYAQCLVVALRCTEKQLPQIYTFGQRIQYDMQAMMLRRMVKRPQFQIVGTPTYTKWMSDKQLSDLLMAK
ncbi:MAG TPA: hypothetical protein VF077_01060 [Nitrospiraceae bacterium]